MSDSTVVIGLQELGARMNMFTDQVQKRTVRKAANAGAAVFQKEMRLRAPVRQDERPMGSKQRMPGYLKKHISRRGKPTADGGFEVQIAPLKSAFYARFLELGTSHQGATPFMRPTFDNKTAAAEEAFATAMRNDIAELLR